MPAAISTQPKDPPAFPLWLHASGQWAKKIRGRTFYFGSDPEPALKRYLAEREDLEAGRTPKLLPGGLSIKELCNRFLYSKKLLMDSGELAPKTWRDYLDVCERLAKHLGKETDVATLRAEDFERLRARLAKGVGFVTLGNRIQRIRTVLKFAFDACLVDVPIRYGNGLKKPSRRMMRRARNQAGPRMFEAAEVRQLLAKAKGPLKAMILLGINCGFGQSDLAGLPKRAIDLRAKLIVFPRPKTEVPRRCPLWPETAAALKAAIAKRPAAKAAADRGLAFITKYGLRWVRQTVKLSRDSVSQEFVKLLSACKLRRRGLGFYALRHTFRTVADGCRDQPAIDHIMGHEPETMAARYRERIDDTRLQRVVDAVRAWLWPADEKKQ